LLHAENSAAIIVEIARTVEPQQQVGARSRTRILQSWGIKCNIEGILRNWGIKWSWGIKSKGF